MSTESPPPPPAIARTHIAANVRRLRKGIGLSQEKLGEMAGFHRTYVSQLERRRTNISVDRLDQLAQFLGVTAVELMQPPPEDEPKSP